MVIAGMELKDTPWKKSYDQALHCIKKQRHYFVNKIPSSQGYGFSTGHVWMWEVDCEETILKVYSVLQTWKLECSVNRAFITARKAVHKGDLGNNSLVSDLLPF